ncbi:MAG TPA: DUF1003 domain-containing protein [Smithellaceae bacterium]|nr:DUF1003 domain-containing protein [Smithellaceae bacterium]
MDKKLRDTANKLFRSEYEKLTKQEKHVVHHINERTPISTNVIQEHSEQLTFGQKMADKVASFGGSWMFIIIFMIVLATWIILNSFLLIKLKSSSFDPYPYIFLNLILSMLAAIQAPIIMMSQNRQAYKDRLSAEHDYEVNLKAELEIIGLHEKVDSLRQEQWKDLIAIQEEQLKLLSQLVEDLKNNRRSTL